MRSTSCGQDSGEVRHKQTHAGYPRDREQLPIQIFLLDHGCVGLLPVLNLSPRDMASEHVVVPIAQHRRRANESAIRLGAGGVR